MQFILSDYVLNSRIDLEHFKCRDQFATHTGNKLLSYDTLEYLGKLCLDLMLLGCREDIDDPVDRIDG